MRGGFILESVMIRLRERSGNDVSSLFPGLDISAPFPRQRGIKTRREEALAGNPHGTDVDRRG